MLKMKNLNYHPLNKRIGFVGGIAVRIFLAVLVMSAFPSCKSSKQVGHGGHCRPDVESVNMRHCSKTQKKIVEEAYTWLGTPYSYAKAEKGSGTDCSGMVMKVYEKVTGEKIPRNSAKQAEYCSDVNAEDVKIGDLIFFATGKDPNRVSHVGIIVDTEKFIHASSSKGVVVSDMTSAYYRRTFMKFGRVPLHKGYVSEL